MRHRVKQLLRVRLIDLVSSCSMWHQPVDGAGRRLISLHSFMLSFHAVCLALPIDCVTLHVPEHTDLDTAPQQFSAVKAACMCQVNASVICLHKAADPHCYVVLSRAILAFTCISSAHSLWPLPYLSFGHQSRGVPTHQHINCIQSKLTAGTPSSAV